MLGHWLTYWGVVTIYQHTQRTEIVTILNDWDAIVCVPERCSDRVISREYEAL